MRAKIEVADVFSGCVAQVEAQAVILIIVRLGQVHASGRGAVKALANVILNFRQGYDAGHFNQVCAVIMTNRGLAVRVSWLNEAVQDVAVVEFNLEGFRTADFIDMIPLDRDSIRAGRFEIQFAPVEPLEFTLHHILSVKPHFVG